MPSGHGQHLPPLQDTVRDQSMNPQGRQVAIL
eukprot:CAMPEP_0204183004 /NCGR_PEP_ID=MMETSP0361-20130328/53240_1 /ASSEMBLY_ACC=CAM_ASM_000343 /TAXON_ID=268821 /ORGANISM="Scrippsiella Hangoei, Strain SHTV-5" /LENGTH=31 /DNA_ID= /DNA_START= /DNA_END= /DNA_ORIENTATION=